MLKIFRRSWPLLVLVPAAFFKVYCWTNDRPDITGRYDSYMESARAITGSRPYSVAESFKRTPAYPVFLAGIMAVSDNDLRAVTLVQHALGLATAFIVMRLVLLLWCSPAAAAAAGLFISFSPAFYHLENSTESEVLSVFLLSIMLLLVTKALLADVPGRRGPAAAGLAGGAAALGRPELAALIVLPPLFLAGKTKGLGPAAAFFLPFALLVGGWMVRNLVVFDSFSISPMGAITSLQTSGPLIDWEAPAHREFKAVYVRLLKANGGSHESVCNNAVAAMRGRDGSGAVRAYIEAAELGTETIRAHPLKYLWATRRNFHFFLGNINTGLLVLAILGFAAAYAEARGPGLMFLLFSVLTIAAANCIVEIGTDRRSFEVYPLLAVFASYLCVYLTPAAVKLYGKIRPASGK